MAALAYAYEDIFGPAAKAAGHEPAGATAAPLRSGGGWGTAIGVAAGVAAAVMFIAFLGLLTAIAIPNFIRARQHAIALHEQQVAPRFGPVMAAVLKSPQQRVAELLDLDTGRFATSTNFGENDRDTHAWIRAHRLDVLGVVEQGQIALLCMDMAVVPAPSNRWDSVNPQGVVTNWGLGQQEPNEITAISPVTDHTDTWLFRTREGGLGILQITGFTDNPRGVRIRYKLVQATAPGEIIDPTTGLPTVPGNAGIDPNTGLPLAGTGTTMDPTTGLPATSRSPGTVPLRYQWYKNEPEKTAVAAAQTWLASIDNGQYAASWTAAADYLRGAVTQDAFASALKSARGPLGKLVSRSLKSAETATSLPGAPDGQYVVMQFNASFANKKSAVETATFSLEKDGQWRAAGYFIN